MTFSTGKPPMPYRTIPVWRSVLEIPFCRPTGPEHSFGTGNASHQDRHERQPFKKNERPTKSSVDLSSLSVVMDFQYAAEPDTGAAFAVSILTRIATPEPAF